MGYLSGAVSRIAAQAHGRYRRYLHWRAHERRVRSRPPEALKARQWRRLQRLLRFAGERVPLYRDKFRAAGLCPDEVRTPQDLRRIPPLTKDEIRRSFPDRILDPDRRFDPGRMGQTSGSTAESLHFVRPDRTYQRELFNAVFLRTRSVTNLPILVLATPHCTAASCGLAEGQAEDLWVSRLYAVPALRHLEGIIALPSTRNVLSAPHGYMERLAEIMDRFAPFVLIADPVYLGAFARYLRRSGRPAPQARHIVSTYELLTPSLGELLRGTFGCEVFTQYGGSEVLDVANECERHRLHVMTENVYVEALRDGRPAGPGEVGRAVLTDLGNYAMPLIRYEIGDVIEPGHGPCPCGRNSPTLAAVHGRAGDLIATADGGLLSPLQADAAFRGAANLAAYRLVQRGANDFGVRLLPDDPARTVDVDGVLARCRRMLGERSRLEGRIVDEIPPERSMKYRFVYSQVGPPAL